jgi:hypothetical protein
MFDTAVLEQSFCKDSVLDPCILNYLIQKIVVNNDIMAASTSFRKSVDVTGGRGVDKK